MNKQSCVIIALQLQSGKQVRFHDMTWRTSVFRNRK